MYGKHSLPIMNITKHSLAPTGGGGTNKQKNKKKFLNCQINQITQILISQTTYTKPVGLEAGAHVAIATGEVQAPATGTAVL